MVKLKKIALVIGSAAVGGTEKQVITLASHLNNEGHNCHLVFLVKGGTLEATVKDLGIRYSIFNLKKNNIIQNLTGTIKLIRFLKVEKFNTHYLFLPHAILLVGPLIRFLANNSKLIYGIRGSIYRKNNIFYRLYRNEIRKADLIICNSMAIVSELKEIKRIDFSKIKLIYNGVKLSDEIRKSSPQFHSETNNKLIVVANFHRYKGHDLLLDSLELIDKPSLEVTFVGDGEVMSDIRNRCKGVTQHKFRFIGQVQNVTEMLLTQNFAVHPSRTEGLSNAILEELAAGLPVVAFDVGGNSELISNCENGYLISLGDLKEFASKIRTLACDHKTTSRMAHNAVISVEDFTWEKNLAHHVACF